MTLRWLFVPAALVVGFGCWYAWQRGYLEGQADQADHADEGERRRFAWNI